MNDAEYDALRLRIGTLIDRWVKTLGLGWWTIAFEYERESAEFHVDDEPRPKTAACCVADWKYIHATITFNMRRCFPLNDDELERIFVHELMHVFLHETREGRTEDGWLHEERVASTLAQAFIWIREDSVKKLTDGRSI